MFPTLSGLFKKSCLRLMSEVRGYTFFVLRFLWGPETCCQRPSSPRWLRWICWGSSLRGVTPVLLVLGLFSLWLTLPSYRWHMRSLLRVSPVLFSTVFSLIFFCWRWWSNQRASFWLFNWGKKKVINNCFGRHNVDDPTPGPDMSIQKLMSGLHSRAF